MTIDYTTLKQTLIPFSINESCQDVLGSTQKSM